MSKRLVRAGNSLALVLDKPLLRKTKIDSRTRLEVSTDGDVIVVTPVRSKRRQERIKRAVARLDREYGGVFKRLAE
jgi:antitoxin component of MazEF toxin-antitoxin module